MRFVPLFEILNFLLWAGAVAGLLAAAWITRGFLRRILYRREIVSHESALSRLVLEREVFARKISSPGRKIYPEWFDALPPNQEVHALDEGDIETVALQAQVLVDTPGVYLRFITVNLPYVSAPDAELRRYAQRNIHVAFRLVEVNLDTPGAGTLEYLCARRAAWAECFETMRQFIAPTRIDAILRKVDQVLADNPRPVTQVKGPEDRTSLISRVMAGLGWAREARANAIQWIRDFVQYKIAIPIEVAFGAVRKEPGRYIRTAIVIAVLALLIWMVVSWARNTMLTY
ncbi:MAG: hypothetical protein ACE15C_06205 [Phycisphaerae bacterium]